jgi:hypothetical protein
LTLNSVYAPVPVGDAVGRRIGPSATTKVPPGSSPSTLPVIVTPPRWSAGSWMRPTVVEGLSMTWAASASS